MADTVGGLPEGFRLDFDAAPEPETRATLAREINVFHSRTVPHESRRFAVLLRDGEGVIKAGVMGTMSWSWLFIEAMWVDDSLRGRGVGRRLMDRAGAHALAEGCHSVWLDTFQAKDFYLALGFEVFGELEAYPAAQSRAFMRKRLAAG